MSDQSITCSDCNTVFVFKEAEQQFYAERGLASPPKRCKACRQARRAQQGGGGDRGGPPRGGPPRGGPRDRDRGPRFSGDPNEYRSPMGSAPSWGARPPRDSRPSGGGGGFDRRGPRAPQQPQEGRDARDRRGPPPPRAQWGSGSRPPRDEAPRAAAPNDAPRDEARPPKAPRARPERPRYDITCCECGTQAQVPFKPLEGRQVFCQPCYRARKGAGAPPDAEGVEADNGIVE